MACDRVLDRRLGGRARRFDDLSSLLSNTFTVPGTDSERARTILQDHFGDRSDGEFLVFRVPEGTSLRDLQPAVARAARAVPHGRPGPLRRDSATVASATVATPLNLADAKGYTDDVLRALEPPEGVTGYVSGQAAIQHDLDPIFSKDLARGESIAIPIALIVLLLVFGLSVIVTMPLLFAAATIMGTLAIVWVAAI